MATDNILCRYMFGSLYRINKQNLSLKLIYWTYRFVCAHKKIDKTDFYLLNYKCLFTEM